MSSRARRILDGDKTQPFGWGTPGLYPPGAAGAGVAPGRQRAAPPLDPSVPLEDRTLEAASEVPSAETRPTQQQHLAALERDAFTKGYAQGERAGLEAGATRADGMLRRLGQTLDELGQLRRTFIAQTERQMVELALAIARRIISREASLDRDLVVAMARVALDRLSDGCTATIRLNPEDYTLATQAHGGQWAGTRVTVMPDATVSRGGCLVESDFGFVDAGVDAQFEQVSKELLGEATEHDDGHVFAAALP